MRKVLGLVAFMAAGCTLTKPLVGQATLMLRPQVLTQTQTVVTPYTKASIDHLSLELYQAGNPTMLAQRTLSAADLDRWVTFSRLKAQTSYKVKALAYTAGNTLISTTDTDSWSEFSVANDDAPTVGTIKVKLINLPFNGEGTSSLGITPGGYLPGDPSNMGFIGLQGIVTTFAGSGATGSVDGQGTSATFNWPRALIVAPNGDVFVADSTNRTIRKITATGWVSTFAGNGSLGTADGLGTAASFNYPLALSLDPGGNLYLADYNANLIRKIAPNGMVSTIAGNGSVGTADGPGLMASFNGPAGVLMTASGDLLVSDRENNRIRLINSSGQVSTWAGNGTGAVVDGPRLTASLFKPSEMVQDSAGNVYIAEYSGQCIRKITPDGMVSVLAGSAPFGFVDGPGSMAKFHSPHSLTIDAHGNLYVADRENHVIRKVYPDGTVATLAGSRGTGFADGTANQAMFYQPFSISIDSQGRLYVADRDNNRIRRIE